MQQLPAGMLKLILAVTIVITPTASGPELDFQERKAPAPLSRCCDSSGW